MRSTSFENGYAVLIGVNDNEVKYWALPIVEKDIIEVGKVLRDPERCGFPANNIRIVTSKNASKDGILNALEWLKNKIDENPQDITAIVYYSGHGWRDVKADSPEYYLIPYDVKSMEDVRSKALKSVDFAAKVNMLKPRRLLVVLDCCHSGGMGVKSIMYESSFVPNAMATDSILKGGESLAGSREKKKLDALNVGCGRAILSSSKGEQYSYPRKDEKMSIFTYHLIEALTGHAQPQEGAREVLVSDIIGHVWRHVKDSTQTDWGELQTPCDQSDGNFPIALILGGKGLKKGQNPPDPLERTFAKNQILVDKTKYISQDDLPEVLGLLWVKKRQPIIPEQVHEKVDIAVNQVLAGKRVVILGEAGIGKSTLLYLVCKRLLELDKKLCTGVPPLNLGKCVFVSDNLPRNLKLLVKLSSLNISVIAASRKYEWLNSPGWTSIELTKNDYTVTILKEILRSVAKKKVIRYSDEGIDLAVEKSGGSPGYLVALVDYLKQSNKMIDRQTAYSVPSTIYDVEAEQLSYIANKHSLSILILYAIAKTKRGRLHMVQTRLLTKALNELKGGRPQKTSDKPDPWTQIIYRDRDLHTIKHDTWKDLLLVDWKRLGIETIEPDALIEARNLRIEGILEDILDSSISHLANLKSESAIRLAQVAVENQPKLVTQLIEIATATKNKYLSTMKPNLLDIAAINNPDKTNAWLQGLNKQQLSKAQISSDEAPSYTILWCNAALEKENAESSSLLDRSNSEISYVLETMQKLGTAYFWKGLQDEAIERLSKALNICRQLVSRDTQFKPILAKTLTSLGESYCEKGLLEKSVNCLKEALNINRETCTKNELYNPDLARALRILSRAYWWKGRLNEAIDYSLEALNIYRQRANTDENFKDELARTLVIFGASCRERGNLKEALNSLNEASEIYGELSRLNDRFRYDQTYALYNLGATYWLSGMLDKAVSALEDARKIDLDFADRDVRCVRDLARTLTNLGIAYRWQGRTDKAVDVLIEAKIYSKKLTDKEGHFKSDQAAYVYVTALRNLSAAYQRKGMLNEAVSCLSEALEINRALPEIIGPVRLMLIDLLITLGLVFAMRGKADDIKNAFNLSAEARELLKKEQDQQSQLGFTCPEYEVLVRGQKDLQSLLLATE